MSAPDPDPSEVRQHWQTARELMAKCPALAVASVSPDGMPNVTPVGSMSFDRQGRGVCLDINFDQLARNVEHNPVVSLLGLRMAPGNWLKGMLKGRFPSPPAVRVVAEMGPRRAATKTEQKRWWRRVKRFKLFPGHDLLWGKLDDARDVTAQRIVPVRMGAMTDGLFGDHASIDLTVLR